MTEVLNTDMDKAKQVHFSEQTCPIKSDPHESTKISQRS